MECMCQKLAGKDVVLSPTCIGHLWVFQDLNPDDIKALAGDVFRKKYSAGQRIFYQGDPVKEVFLIKAGRVKLSKLMEDGDEITLDIRQAGDFLGENMFSEDMDYPVTAMCIEDALICGFTKNGFEQLVLRHPNIGLQVIKNLSKRISYLTSRVGSMTITNLADRLYGVLVNVAREHGAPSESGLSIPFPLTHEDLSFLVGAHRVSITRAMRDLKESGRISQEGRRLTVFASKNFM